MNMSNYLFQKQTHSTMNNPWSQGGIYMQNNTDTLHSVWCDLLMVKPYT